MRLKELKTLVETNESFNVPTRAQEREWIISKNISELVNHSYHKIVKILEDYEYDRWREEDIISDMIILLYEYAPDYTIDHAWVYKSWIERKLVKNYKFITKEEEKEKNLNEYKEILVDNNDYIDKIEMRLIIIDYLSEGAKRLNDNQKYVLYKYFIDDMTLKDIAKYKGLSSTRIGQILAKALRIIYNYQIDMYNYGERVHVEAILKAREEYEKAYEKRKLYNCIIPKYLYAALESSDDICYPELNDSIVIHHIDFCKRIAKIFSYLFKDFRGIMFVLNKNGSADISLAFNCTPYNYNFPDAKFVAYNGYNKNVLYVNELHLTEELRCILKRFIDKWNVEYISERSSMYIVINHISIDEMIKLLFEGNTSNIKYHAYYDSYLQDRNTPDYKLALTRDKKL